MAIDTTHRTDAPLVPCPVEQAIQAIGGKWKLLVLRRLLLSGPQRYNELLAGVTGISAKELTRNLRELAGTGLVARSGDGVIRTSQYALTPLGSELMPAFASLLTWGQKLMQRVTNLPVR